VLKIFVPCLVCLLDNVLLRCILSFLFYNVYMTTRMLNDLTADASQEKTFHITKSAIAYNNNINLIVFCIFGYFMARISLFVIDHNVCLYMITRIGKFFFNLI